MDATATYSGTDEVTADLLALADGPRTPVDNLYATPIAISYFETRQLQNVVVVSPVLLHQHRPCYHHHL